ncbi:HD domain-containing protein [Oceanimonas baumannii]|uniref:HD domain-containing protein n=1 Tax=Oceanimonas baumannii TaxID=129578 RepID=UPI003A92AFFA
MLNQAPTKDNIIEMIEAVFTRHGADSYLGEQVTMAQHMLQAAWLGELQGESDAVVLAALLHDVGHYANKLPPEVLMSGTDNRHQESAASWLAPFFPAEIIEPIRLHVAAKRYLVTVDPDYRNQLSQASIDSLALQGGMMSAREVHEMEANPYLDMAIRVRRLDDQGKDPALTTPDFGHFKVRLDLWLLSGDDRQ